MLPTHHNVVCVALKTVQKFLVLDIEPAGDTVQTALIRCSLGKLVTLECLSANSFPRASGRFGLQALACIPRVA